MVGWVWSVCGSKSAESGRGQLMKGGRGCLGIRIKGRIAGAKGLESKCWKAGGVVAAR